jgi:hypothetical protein
MREVSDAFLAAVGGSNTPVVYADVWYGSEIHRQGIPVAGGDVSWDSRQAVEDRCSLTLVDDKSRGSRLKSIVHAYGCRVNVRAGFALPDGEETCSLGWFDITDTDAVEDWRWYDWRDEATKVSEAVAIKAEGLMSVVDNSRLFAPFQPVPASDAWATIRDLCLDVVSVLDPGFDAKSIPSGSSAIAFDTDRLKAVRSVASLWGAKPVITDDGQLTLVLPGTGPSTPDYGIRINIDAWRNQTSSVDIYNGVAFRGKTTSGIEIWGYATEDSGPLFWGGPFGRRPAFASSDLMTTQAMVDAAAATELARLKTERSAVQKVKALWNPAQEVRDRPMLQLPDRAVQSEVLAIKLPLTKGSMGAMDVTLRLPLFTEV